MIRIRIVNKSKNGVTLDLKVRKETLSWNDFNESFDIDKNDKFYAIMKADKEKECEGVVPIVNEAVTSLLMARSNDPHMKLSAMYQFSQLSEKYCKQFNASPAEFTNLVSIAYRKQIDGMLGLGIGFTNKDDAYILNSKQNRQNRRNLKRLENEKSSEDSKKFDTFTIGDAIKAKENI